MCSEYATNTFCGDPPNVYGDGLCSLYEEGSGVHLGWRDISAGHLSSRLRSRYAYVDVVANVNVLLHACTQASHRHEHLVSAPLGSAVGSVVPGRQRATFG